MTKHLVLLFTSDFNKLPCPLQQEVYSEFFNMVYPMVQFIVRDHGAAEDIIQESFLRAIEKAPQLHEIERLESWLKTLTRNMSLNYFRKLRRNRDELDPEAVFLSRESSSLSPFSEPEKEVESRFMQQAIIQYIDQLKPDYRQILEMRWIHRMSYKEMSEALSTTEGVVRQKLFRAREAIKERLKADWGIR